MCVMCWFLCSCLFRNVSSIQVLAVLKFLSSFLHQFRVICRTIVVQFVQSMGFGLFFHGIFRYCGRWGAIIHLCLMGFVFRFCVFLVLQVQANVAQVRHRRQDLVDGYRSAFHVLFCAFSASVFSCPSSVVYGGVVRINFRYLRFHVVVLCVLAGWSFGVSRIWFSRVWLFAIHWIRPP